MPVCPSPMIRALHTVASGSGPSHIKVIRQRADPYSIPCIEGHGSHVRRLEGVIMSGATLLFIGTSLRRRSDVSSPRLSSTGNTVDTSFLSQFPWPQCISEALTVVRSCTTCPYCLRQGIVSASISQGVRGFVGGSWNRCLRGDFVSSIRLYRSLLVVTQELGLNGTT